jgi:hypothetical protein
MGGNERNLYQVPGLRNSASAGRTEFIICRILDLKFEFSNKIKKSEKICKKTRTNSKEPGENIF